MGPSLEEYTREEGMKESLEDDERIKSLRKTYTHEHIQTPQYLDEKKGKLKLGNSTQKGRIIQISYRKYPR